MGLLSGFEHFIRQGELLAPYTCFHLGGPAEYFAEPTTVDELVALVRRCREEDVQIRLIGSGANLLIRDEAVSGVVLHLDAPDFCAISIQGRTVSAGGGAKLGHVISSTVREGLAGLEQLVGIPGTVGGALHGNSGSHGGDIGQFTQSATVLTRSGELITRQREEMHFAYRQSSLDELVILEAQFLLEEEDPEELTRRMQKLWIVKKASQPMGGLNTGRIFKNPRGMTAAALIEQADLKGANVAQAELSQQHPNYIIANPDATSQDVLQLIDLVRQQVASRTGVELENEIEIW